MKQNKAPNRKPLKVLLAEDSAYDIELMQREVLRTFGAAEFVCVDDPEAYRDAIREFEPDIILSDFRMPRFDGLKALEIAREMEPDTPFLIVTGTINEETAVDCIKAGAWDYVIKERLNRLGQSMPNVLEQKRLRIEKRVAESEREKLITAVEQTGEIVVITDLNGCIEYVNPAYESVTGYSKEEAVGSDYRIITENSEESLFGVQEATLSGTTWKGRRVNRRRDGSEFTEDISISPIFGRNGRILHYVCVCRDVSAQIKQSEKQQELERKLRQSQKLEAIGRLAGGIAHDFNNMLTVILGYGDLIENSLSSDDPNLSRLRKMLDAGNRSAELTHQLLAYSRNQKFDLKHVDLNPMIIELEDMLRRLIGEDVRFEVILGPKTRPVLADPGRIGQVIMNLVINARDAMPKGGHLTIRSKLTRFSPDNVIPPGNLKPGDYMLIEVIDTGTGIPPDVIDQIFEPFYTTKDPGKGTGLGLSTVYGIVKQTGGTILVSSTVNSGSTFQVYLPVTDSNTINTAIPENQTVHRKTSGKIMVVEDERDIRDLIVSVLNKKGYEVRWAANGTDAWKVLEQAEWVPDVLLTDVIMPGMSGFDLMQRFAKIHPKSRVILMSGYTADNRDLERVFRIRTPFLEKPIRTDILIKAVAEAMYEE